MSIRTPDDEIDKPGYFYPPFKEGLNYQGITYGQRVENGQTKPGHSPFSTDFNRRTPSGGWLDDTGHPVLAAADGRVSEVDKAEGLVMVNHWNGTYRTEYRHMTDIPVKVGQKVQRGDRLGSIGNVAGSGASFGAHLHHVHWRRVGSGPWNRIKMAFEGKEVATSVFDSDTRPEGWNPPAPVNVEGPPPKATWESAYKAAAKALEKADQAREDWREKAALFKEEKALAIAAVEDMKASLAAARARIVELENAAPAPDCTAALAAERERIIAAIKEAP